MGRCYVCDKDTGWGNGNMCDKHNSYFVKYGDRVQFIRGFYRGRKGKIIKYLGFYNTMNFSGGDNRYEIILENNDVVMGEGREFIKEDLQGGTNENI